VAISSVILLHQDNLLITGVNFRETFAPVTKLASIQSTIALAVAHDWELHQMDVNSAYLNGDLEKTIFMDLPPGYAPPGSTVKVCKLKKSIYGLKQAGHQ
jgi:Reverse transcriptase (RNA-dependent DNA polymerase)